MQICSGTAVAVADFVDVVVGWVGVVADVADVLLLS